MKKALPAALLLALLIGMPSSILADYKIGKDHDFLPKFHNVIFLMDVSDSMMEKFRVESPHPKIYVATRAFKGFNLVMPHVPRWQYDVNSALITFGDRSTPSLIGTLSPWTRTKYQAVYTHLRKEGFNPKRTAGFQEALQLAGSLIGAACGRTAIVAFTDGGSSGECPQCVATALKEQYGDKVVIYGVFLGAHEDGWRNLYETCKLTGGYCRYWHDVADKMRMQEFSWDILVREIMFPYPEIFFKHKSAEVLPSEAMKLEAVANFLHAIPQYVLQIDGHNDFLGDFGESYELAAQRAENVKQTLVKVYKVHPSRIRTRSWGEELPRYDNRDPNRRFRNRQANLYLMLPLRNFPYDEKNLHTFGVKAVGNIFNTKERYSDTEWAWPDKPPPGSRVPVSGMR